MDIAKTRYTIDIGIQTRATLAHLAHKHGITQGEAIEALLSLADDFPDETDSVMSARRIRKEQDKPTKAALYKRFKNLTKEQVAALMALDASAK